MELEDFTGAANPMSSQHTLAMRREERIRRITQQVAAKEGVAYAVSDDESWQEKVEIPAYKRRKVRLFAPHPSTENISRFQLDEERGLSEDNRFLHDNVD